MSKSAYWEKWESFILTKIPSEAELTYISPNPHFWDEIIYCYKLKGKEYVASIKEPF